MTALAAALRRGDPDVVLQAALDLEEAIGRESERTDEELLARLRDLQGPERMVFLLAWQRARSGRQATAFEKALSIETDPLVRFLLIQGISRGGSALGKEVEIDVLNGRDSRGWKALLSGVAILAQRGATVEPSSVAFAEQWLDKQPSIIPGNPFRAASGPLPRSILEVVVRELESALPTDLRRDYWELLAQHASDPNILDVAVRAAEGNVESGRLAVSVLERAPSDTALPLLRRFAQAGSPDLRGRAVRAMRAHPDAGQSDWLLGRLAAESEPEVRKAILDVLISRRSGRAAEAFELTLQREQDPSVICDAIRQIVGAVPTAETRNRLEGLAASHSSENVRTAARLALQQLRPLGSK